MYVCLCHGVTERDIRETLAEGATSVEEVAHCTGAGTQCGSCVHQIARMVEDHTGGSGGGARGLCLRVLTSAA